MRKITIHLGLNRNIFVVEQQTEHESDVNTANIQCYFFTSRNEVGARLYFHRHL